MHNLRFMMQQSPKTSEYSNDNREQVISAMKVEQEQGKVNQTQTLRIVIEVRAPRSTSLPSPEGLLATFTITKIS